MPAVVHAPKKCYTSIANGGVNSDPVSVPEHVNSLTVVVPTALDGVTDTWKFQSLDPVDGTTWRDLYIHNSNAATATLTQLSGFGINRVIVFPYNQMGNAVLRVVSTAAVNALRTFCFIFDRA